MSEAKTKLLIGRKEKIDLPTLGLKNLEAKVDTGAYTSSLHCHHISLELQGKKEWLCFNLLDPSHKQYELKQFRVAEFKQKIIKNSFGESERRFVVKIPILVHGLLSIAEFSLSDRSSMKCPVLLGRKLLKKGFVVDVTKYNLGLKANKEYRKGKKK